ncbi:MAG: hypothetical protein KJ879_01150 [Nanoarchaeota archaeon]|nr:hypothetical protein [Nanoarchaeota archaeon]
MLNRRMKPGTLWGILGITLLTACAGDEKTDLKTYHGYTEWKEPGATLYAFDEEEMEGNASLKKRLEEEKKYRVTHTKPSFWYSWGKIKSIAPDTTSTTERPERVVQGD